MPAKPNESRFEESTLERLKRLHYRHDLGGELREDEGFPLEAVVMTGALRRHLRAR